jgi:hypothetical protein
MSDNLLSDRVRDPVEREYLELHLAEYQYGDPNIKTDPASRVAPSKYAKKSSTPSNPSRWANFLFESTGQIRAHLRTSRRAVPFGFVAVTNRAPNQRP